jgi:hypothetical protein
VFATTHNISTKGEISRFPTLRKMTAFFFAGMKLRAQQVNAKSSFAEASREPVQLMDREMDILDRIAEPNSSFGKRQRLTPPR